MTELVESPDVFGSTVFCDDVRAESSGKLTLVGVYQGVMMIHTHFPTRLPTMSFVISLSQKREVFTPRIVYRVFLPGDSADDSSEESSIVVEMNEDVDGATLAEVESAADQTGIPLDTRGWVRSSAILQFQSFELKVPGAMKVRADANGKRYRLGSLAVVAASTASPHVGARMERK